MFINIAFDEDMNQGDVPDVAEQWSLTANGDPIDFTDMGWTSPRELQLAVFHPVPLAGVCGVRYIETNENCKSAHGDLCGLFEFLDVEIIVD